MHRMNETLAAMARRVTPPAVDSGRLEPFTDFAGNPGGLTAHAYVPPGLQPGAPLLVVLHGCTQNAAGYDLGAGWSALAEEQGFALLFPEQSAANNPNLCFNWFRPGDTARGRGEGESIRQMVEAMVTRHRLDRARLHVTGLSAGGAMAAALLGTYPDVFAGGAIIAGLPAGCATTIPQALERMRGLEGESPAVLAARLAAAQPGRTDWPRVSIWTGDADTTVAPVNAERLAQQWCRLHGLAEVAPEPAVGTRLRRQAWRGGDGEVKVELVSVAGLGHGTPIDGRESQAAPFLIDVGLSSSRAIADFLGLTQVRRETMRPAPAPRESAKVVPIGVAARINAALRAAGLMH